ncbi:MAG: efflux RND transporter periplasmic adaptor subunit [bacterium]
MKKKYWLLLAVVVGLLAGGYFIYSSTRKAAGYEWKFAVIEKGDISTTVTATGTLSAVTTVQVGTQVSGTIDKILVDFNDHVRQGEVIAILDTSYLAASLQDAYANFHRNEVQMRQTKRDYDRAKLLFEQKVVAEADYDLALTTYETALTNLRSSEAALNRAKINLKYATITAPIAGIVVSRAVDVGQTVASSFNTPTLFTIANDLTKMQVQASVDEADIGKILVGQAVTFTVDAYTGQTFEGKVSQIRLLPTVVQNVVNYTVIIDVPNPEMKLLPGMTANITIVVEEVTNVLKVPSVALRFNPPQEYINSISEEMPDSIRQRWERFQQGSQEVRRTGSQEDRRTGSQEVRRPGGSGRPAIGTLWVKEGEKIVPRRVRVGLSDGSFTQVMGRVEEGEEVVTGMNSEQATTNQQTNPFAPQVPRGRR